MIDYTQHKPATFEYVGKWIRNWFSNMVESPFTMDKVNYLSVENRYQACKATNADDHLMIASVSPREAKKLGRKIAVRADWEDVRYEVMKTALRAKFSIPEWRDKLLATGNELIIEWNNWNDSLWGVPVQTNRGQNLLGKALMEIREELTNKTNY